MLADDIFSRSRSEKPRRTSSAKRCGKRLTFSRPCGDGAAEIVRADADMVDARRRGEALDVVGDLFERRLRRRAVLGFELGELRLRVGGERRLAVGVARRAAASRARVAR